MTEASEIAREVMFIETHDAGFARFKINIFALPDGSDAKAQVVTTPIPGGRFHPDTSVPTSDLDKMRFALRYTLAEEYDELSLQKGWQVPGTTRETKSVYKVKRVPMSPEAQEVLDDTEPLMDYAIDRDEEPVVFEITNETMGREFMSIVHATDTVNEDGEQLTGVFTVRTSKLEGEE